jgi:hypothetical protein
MPELAAKQQASAQGPKAKAEASQIKPWHESSIGMGRRGWIRGGFKLKIRPATDD